MGDIVRRVSKANPKLSELVIPEGKVLFHEGDKASAMYIVQDGEIEISIDNAQYVVAHLRKGASFGEQSVIGTKHRLASARASTEAVCLEIPASWLEKQITNAAPFLKTVFSSLTLQLLQTNFTSLKANSGEEKARFRAESGKPSGVAYEMFSTFSQANSVYLGDSYAIHDQAAAGNGLVVTSGEIKVVRNGFPVVIGPGGVIGVAEAIAGARAQHDYEIMSAANALVIDGDSAYSLIKKLNKGLYGVVKGFVSRAISDDSLPNRLSATLSGSS